MSVTSRTPSSARSALGGRAYVAARRQADLVELAHQRDQLAARALGDDPALVDDPDAVAEALRLLHVMGRVEDGHALVAERLDAGEDGVAALRVDTDRRLVEDQQARPVEQPDGDIQAALHPAGVVLGPLPCPVGQVDDRQNVVDAGRQLPAAQPVQPAKEDEVLARAEVRVDREILGHETDRCLRRGRLDVKRSALDDDRSPVAGEDPADHRDRRRLARPVRTEEAVRLAAGDLEADAVDGLAGPEPLAKIGARQDGLAGRRCRPSRRRQRQRDSNDR